MKSTYTFIFLVLIVYQTDLYSYPKILPVKSNPDYLLITQNTLPIIDLTINLNAGSSHDGSLPGLTNLSFESISKLKYKDEIMISSLKMKLEMKLKKDEIKNY